MKNDAYDWGFSPVNVGFVLLNCTFMLINFTFLLHEAGSVCNVNQTESLCEIKVHVMRLLP